MTCLNHFSHALIPDVQNFVPRIPPTNRAWSSNHASDHTSKVDIEFDHIGTMNAPGPSSKTSDWCHDGIEELRSAYSSRVSCLHFEIVDTKFVAIVCYMPTSWDTDAAVEEVYLLLEMLIHTAERIKAVSLFGGDFNACIGAPKAGDDLTLIGACGNGARNRRGARMIHWILEHGLQVLNRLDATMTIEKCWTCRRAMDGALVQLDFLLASLRVRVVRAWVDQSLPVGVDHRCVHSFIRIGGLRPAQIKRCTNLKHWQPDLDENGTPAGFHTTVTTALTKLPAVSAEGLEQCLVVAGRNHGRHGSQHLQIVGRPSASETPNQRSTKSKTAVLPNPQITSKRVARLEIKSVGALIETVFKVENFADNGLWNWSLAATTTAAIRIC